MCLELPLISSQPFSHSAAKFREPIYAHVLVRMHHKEEESDCVLGYVGTRERERQREWTR